MNSANSVHLDTTLRLQHDNNLLTNNTLCMTEKLIELCKQNVYASNNNGCSWKLR
jgi:hypothetical protein